MKGVAALLIKVICNSNFRKIPKTSFAKEGCLLEVASLFDEICMYKILWKAVLISCVDKKSTFSNNSKLI